MRPHHLRCTAFGPFAATVDVDLDLLSASGLFLLHGETGAGKTTLLDALGFALYGTVPGERAKAGRLRSDHADQGVRTQVQLEVTLSGRRLRITRSPQQQRAKLRGSGTVVEQARVLLEEQVCGAWRPLSTRVGEADAEIHELVGMSAEQFFQVVLLPQGEFARFLRAGSKARGELLEKLFGTDRFRAVEEWLAHRRLSAFRDVEAAQARVALSAALVAQAAGAAADDAAGSEWADELLAQARRHLSHAQAAAVSRAAVRDDARRRADAAATLDAAQTRRRSLLAEAAELAVQEPAIVALSAECSAAARAASVAGSLEQAARRRAEVERARQGVTAARDLLPGIGLSQDLAAPALRLAAEQAHARCGHLEALRTLATAMAEDETSAAEALAERAAHAERAEQVGGQLASLPARLRQLSERVLCARAAAVRLPAARAQQVALREAVADEIAAGTLDADLGQLREELLLARESAVGLRDKAAEVREARLDDVRFELASMLVEGDPCAVCGSTSHPDPSQVRGERVTRDDEDAARFSYEAAQRQVEELGVRMAAAQVERDGRRARLARWSGLDLAQALAAAEVEVRALEPLVAGLEAEEAAVRALDEEQSTLEQQRSALEVAIEASTRRALEAGARAARARADLARELRGAVDLDAALSASTALHQAAEQAVAAQADLERAEQEQAAATRDAHRAAVGAGFVDVGQAASACRPGGWRAAAEQTLRAHGDRLAASAAALADADLQVALAPPAPVAAAAAQLREADHALEEATALAATARSRAEALEDLVPRLRAARAELEPAVARAQEVRELADLCNGAGTNQLRMTLSSFVLAARLEEVAAAASVRLLRMTQGRYTLVHSAGTARGGARSGLGLLARDSWTGQDRETSTLSGGETFLASLALALALTDVVTAEAGGARMDALFVDEGFGTLDEDTLDEVMDVLDGLREGGRLVGLVSHVAELRARVPAQVHVRKGRTGSDVVLVGCGP